MKKKNFALNINKKEELSDIYKAKNIEILDKDIIEKIEKEKLDVTLPEKEFKIGKKYIQFHKLLMRFPVFFQNWFLCRGRSQM